MPWTAEDAERHTKKADSAKRQRMWAEIANSVLADTGDEGRAIREANAMVGRDHEKPATARLATLSSMQSLCATAWDGSSARFQPVMMSPTFARP